MPAVAGKLQATPLASGGSYLYSSGATTDALTLHFAGTTVTVVYVAHPAFGIMAIEVDGTVVRTVDTYAENATFDGRALVGYLDPEPHILRVYASSGVIAIDAFIAGIPQPTVAIPTATPNDYEPPPSYGVSSFSVSVDVYLETASTTELVDHILNEVNENPEQHYLITLTADTYTFTAEHVVGGIQYSAMPVVGQVTLVGENGLDEQGNSLNPDQITTWNVINKSSGAGDIDLFHIGMNARLTLYNVWLEDGGGPTRFSGGGIVNDGELYIYNSYLQTSRANVFGGGIHNNGTLVIINSELSSNRAEYDGSPLSSGGAGSAIINEANASLTAYCTYFRNNYVEPTLEGGTVYVPFTIPGGAIYNKSVNFDVQHSNFINNNAGGQNPYCSSFPTLGFCPLHIRDLASTVHVEAINNHWSDPSVWTPAGVLAITIGTNEPEIHYGDFSREGEPYEVPALQLPTCPVTLISSVDFATVGVSQEATDMLAIASPDGLYLHAAPSINAPRVEATNPLWAGDPSMIPWGTQDIPALARLAFNDQAQVVGAGETDVWLVWYQVDFKYNFDTDDDGDFEITDANAWVSVKLHGHNSQGNIADFQYYDATDEPCSDLEPPDQVTFPYDRQRGVKYAIANTYQNQFSPPPDTFMTQRLSNPTILATFPSGLSVSSIPYGYFETNTVAVHTGGATGSAAFISQSIWVGGMPMTRDMDAYSITNSTCRRLPDQPAVPILEHGWRHCTNTSGNGDGNRVWLNHAFIVPYYTSNVLPDVHEVDEHANGSEPDEHFPDGPAQPLSLLPLNNRGTAVPVPIGIIAEVAINSGILTGVVDLSIGDVVDPVGVFTLVKAVLTEGGLGVKGLIRFGDYAWINTGSATADGDDDLTHGLLVAGWGEAKDCPVVIGPGGQQVILDSVNLFPTFEQSVAQIQNPVPYVVDFSWKIQQPIPRPFYCTRFDAQYSTTFYGGGILRNWDRFDDAHDWYFFALPDTVIIEQPELLFADPEWVWNANAGVIP